MSRDQRVRDNWALLYAQQEAIKRKVPLVVLFCFVPNFLKGTLRQYGFMLRGLPQIENSLRKRNIPFFFLSGEPREVIPKFLRHMDASSLYVDFSPLRTKKRWLRDVMKLTSLPIFEVDTHNVIPCWKLFSKQADTMESFRVKLRGAIPTFLNAFPTVRKHPISFQGKVPVIAWDSMTDVLPLDRSVTEISWAQSGEDYAQKAFRHFLKQKIHEYKSGQTHNGMRGEWQWRLQPYFHFGQLSAQKIIWAVMHSEIDPRFKAEFLETLITQRELADHFCYYNTYYHSFRSFPKWAQETLEKHRHDARGYLYSKRVLESAGTHDELWNTIQRELVSSGRMFGWANKYWAKKIFEWARSPEEALRFATGFMEKYAISSWDPNGYLSIVKAIGGVYEEPSETTRPIYGRVPYMPSNYREARRDLRTYAKKS
jgi:deoxyribodipyrimidine photo-lyase